MNKNRLQPCDTTWVILAGGQATRMNGQDKGLIPLNGVPLIHYVLSKVSNQTNNILINANRNLPIYQEYAPVISDEFSGFPGPMGGIHTGIKHADTDWIGFIPCDSPNINDDLITRFCHQADDNVDILVAHDGEFKQPVFTMYHKRVLPKLEAFLQRGDRKIVLLYNECNTKYVDFSDSPSCFINLNTPTELAEFARSLN